MGTRGRVDTSPAAQGCPRGLKLRVQYESHTLREGLTASGARGYWRALLDEQLRRSRHRYVSAFVTAQLHAHLGDRDQAFESLDRAYEERVSKLVYLKVDPAFDSIRSDPRFAALVKKVGL